MDRLSKRINNRLLSISRFKRIFLTSTVILLVLSKIILLTINQMEEERRISEIYANFPPAAHVDYSWFFIHLRMSQALVVGAIAFWAWRAGGFLISALSFVWVAIEYGVWYSRSLTKKEYLALDGFQMPGIAGFYEGTWWDIVFLVLTLLLLAWIIKTFISAFISSSIDGSEDKRLNEPKAQ